MIKNYSFEISYTNAGSTLKITKDGVFSRSVPDMVRNSLRNMHTVLIKDLD